MPTLERLCEGPHEVAAVVSQPDRPRGRRGRSEPSPVAQAAGAAGVFTLRVPTVGAPDVVSALSEHRPDLGVVVAFGQFIPKRVRHHLTQHSKDKSSFPYRTKLPTTPVYYLCQRHPELTDTPVGATALGQTALDDATDDESRVRASRPYDPNPGTRPSCTRFTVFTVHDSSCTPLSRFEFSPVHRACPRHTRARARSPPSSSSSSSSFGSS